VSSAILYFAIVAIWAGVLMPRWLRPGRRRRVEVTEHFEMHTEVYEAEARPVGGSATEREITVEEDITWTEDDAAERRANILKARRRMLGTLVFLTVVALGIAVLGVAAWWVIIPPGVMLGGFVLLLREASRSDAERTRRLAHAAELRREQAEPEFEQAAPAAAETLERLVSKPVAPDVAEEAEPAERAEPAARAEPAEPAEPVIEVVAYSAEIIDISGRVSDQLYDQYTDAANRAVGD
jgi:hypothetical protein